MTGAPPRVLRLIARLNVGGPARHIAILAKRLPGFGFSHLTVYGRPGPAEGDMSDLLEGSPSIMLPRLSASIAPWNDGIVLSKLIRLIANFQPDIVHTHTAKAGTLGRVAAVAVRIASRRHRPKLIHTYHGHVFANYFGRWPNAAIVGVERALATQTDRLVALSNSQADELSSTYRIAPLDRFTVVPLGLELRPFTEHDSDTSFRQLIGAGPGDYVVGFVGRLVPVKRIDVVLHAIQRLRSVSSNRIRLVIVGDGPLSSTLRELAADLDLGQVVHFAGWRRDIERLYPSFDAVVLTSDNEGTPVSVIEAMATARPVVSTRVGGVADIVSHGVNGILVDRGDFDAVARAIAELMANPLRAQEIGRTARRDVLSRFSAERLVQDMVRLYEQTLSITDSRAATPLSRTIG